MHACLGFRRARQAGELDEFSFLKQFMTDDWIQSVIEEVMAPHLIQCRSPAERKLPTIEEFWVLSLACYWSLY
jgi:hypothetical protein